MDPKTCLKFLFFLVSSGLQFSVVSATFIYYGNNATERITSGMDSSIPSEPRIWIDDPLNCDSCPRWGYLQLYHVYIHAFSSSSSTTLPRLFLQIWSNTTMYNNYTLKWQKVLDNYQRGKLYKVAPDAGQVVEVNEMDRIGFTSEGNGNTIALDLEVDDSTASKAHRTYFRQLSRDSNVLPVVGDYRYVDNNALRGRYSIGIELDNAPPRKSTEVYLGHELIRRQGSGPFPDPSKVIVDESIALVSGRVTSFYFRLAQLNTGTSMQLYIWQKTNSDSYILTYIRSVALTAGPEQTRNVSLPDGPLVDSSHRFGWYIPTGLFYSSSSSGACHFSLSSPGASNTVGQTYDFDGLSWQYDMSIGVIVDQQASTTSTNNNVIPPTLKPEEGRKSNSPAIQPNKMIILGLVVTLHLLIASISS